MFRFIILFAYFSCLWRNPLMMAQHKALHVNRDTVFHCNGKVKLVIGTDQRHKYHGDVKHYNDLGELIQISHYLHGELDGPEIYFSTIGDTLSIQQWKKGVLHGPYKVFYPHNRVMFSEQYFAGKLRGTSIYSDTSGKMAEGYLKRFYSEKASFIRTVFCRNGKPEGEVVVYDGNGQLLSRTHYINGFPVGKSFSYHQNKVIAISNFEKGEYVKEEDQNYSHHIQVYNNFLKEDDKSEHFLFLRGIAFLHTGNKTNALEDLDKVISVNNKNYKAYYNRAVILSDSLPKEAMKDLLSTVKIKDDFYMAHYNMGILHYRDSQYKKARDCFKKVIKIQPDHYGSFHNLSMTYGLLGDKNMEDYYKKEAERLIPKQ